MENMELGTSYLHFNVVSLSLPVLSLAVIPRNLKFQKNLI